MPKLKNKHVAVKQLTEMACLLKESLDKKLGEWCETTIGRGELKETLGKRGERFKDVLSLALKKFHVKRFLDSDAEIQVEVEDYEKPILKVRRLKKNEDRVDFHKALKDS